MSDDPNDAIQSLARLAAAAARLMAHMHYAGHATDPEEEVAHMQANLDRVAEKIKDQRDPTWRYRL